MGPVKKKGRWGKEKTARMTKAPWSAAGASSADAPLVNEGGLKRLSSGTGEVIWKAVLYALPSGRS